MELREGFAMEIAFFRQVSNDYPELGLTKTSRRIDQRGGTDYYAGKNQFPVSLTLRQDLSKVYTDLEKQRRWSGRGSIIVIDDDDVDSIDNAAQGLLEVEDFLRRRGRGFYKIHASKDGYEIEDLTRRIRRFN